MEKDLSRIVAKAGIEVPEASETENADTMAGQLEDTDINVADFSGYETVQKEFEKLCAEIEASLEIQKVEHQEGLRVIGAMYHLENGLVDFI